MYTPVGVDRMVDAAGGSRLAKDAMTDTPSGVADDPDGAADTPSGAVNGPELVLGSTVGEMGPGADNG